jgi:hypothetical protein
VLSVYAHKNITEGGRASHDDRKAAALRQAEFFAADGNLGVKNMPV